MEILVTGANGFVGRSIVKFLSKKHHIVMLIRDQAQIKPGQANDYGRCDIVEMDLSSQLDKSRLPSKVDVIIHLAHFRGNFPEQAQKIYQIDTMATLQLLEYGKDAGISNFIYGSSGNVYGFSNEILREDHLPDPAAFYGVVKYSSELLVRCYQPFFNTSIVRMFVPYGPGQTNRMIPSIIERVLSREPVIITNGGQPKTNPIFINDLVQLITEIVTMNGHHLINVGGPNVYSIADIAGIIGKITGIEPILKYQTDSLYYNFIGDISRMKELIPTVDPVDLEVGLKIMLASLHCN